MQQGGLQFQGSERGLEFMGKSGNQVGARAILVAQIGDVLEDQDTTDAINLAIDGLPDDSAFTNAAAKALATE